MAIRDSAMHCVCSSSLPWAPDADIRSKDMQHCDSPMLHLYTTFCTQGVQKVVTPQHPHQLSAA